MSDSEETSSHGLLPGYSKNPASSNSGENATAKVSQRDFTSSGPYRRRSNSKNALSPSSTYGQIESHQFDPDESEVWKHHQLERHFEDQGT